ncbi:MerR family transcriptional regulator (plasmid) [Lysinibacillus capsici]|uniref:MerR family transcriptional regulator n=1 Tax=Lysinibacillus capsici TaxID=2115968 RepID=UPI0021D89213|nr:MerR family transcriptional regulator [Lysinibacillus capsici]UYB50291.1 MerR family transcriptional regulator [Lysinibacillus capsici]
MRIPISRLAKELNLEAYQLREWEKRGWLGEVVKDPRQNQQRVYTEEQVERIQLIAETIQAQRAIGIKRTDFEEVEARLLEQFGEKLNGSILIWWLLRSPSTRLSNCSWDKTRKSTTCSS